MRGRRISIPALLLVAGVAGVAGGFLQSPDRAWANLLVASLSLVGLGLAGLLLVAIEEVCGATWSAALRPVPLAMSAALVPGGVGLVATIAIHPELYPWMRDPNLIAGFKAWWLQPPWFWGRLIFYLAIWIAFRQALGRIVTTAGRGEGVGARSRPLARWAVAFLLVFAPTFWLASVDWVMSLEPRWHSTIFGFYHFTGLLSSGLAALALLVVWLERRGTLAGLVTPRHLHDVGTLLFACCTLWMYAWFSQYLLVWYANLPEEAAYFVRRRAGSWLAVWYLTVVFHWAAPFVVLLIARVKQRGAALAAVAAVVLAGRWLDLYGMIAPAVTSGGPQIGPGEVGAMLVAGTVFLRVFLRAFRVGAAVAAVDTEPAVRPA